MLPISTFLNVHTYLHQLLVTHKKTHSPLLRLLCDLSFSYIFIKQQQYLFEPHHFLSPLSAPISSPSYSPNPPLEKSLSYLTDTLSNLPYPIVTTYLYEEDKDYKTIIHTLPTTFPEDIITPLHLLIFCKKLATDFATPPFIEGTFEQISLFLKDEKKATLLYLQRLIQAHRKMYYEEGTSILSDTAFDHLVHQLATMEEKAKIAQRVATAVGSPAEQSIAHLSPMLSLQNVFDTENLYKWSESIGKMLLNKLDDPPPLEYVAEPKLDGTSLSLVYEEGRLLRALTRGDGIAGEMITENMKGIASVPLTLPMYQYGIKQIEIRGEVIIENKDFEAIVRKYQSENATPPTNARNFAAGSLRLKDPDEVRHRKLQAHMYHISHILMKDGKEIPFHTHKEALLWLSQFFITPLPYLFISQDIKEIAKHLTEMDTKKNSFPFHIDGFVIKVNGLNERPLIGTTSHHPKWAIAWKFPTESAVAKIEEIHFQVGRTGTITPVAKITPTYLSGVTISSISLFNEKNLYEKDIRLNDHVRIERAGEVIPYIKEVLKTYRKGNEQPIIFPTQCPICITPLVQEEEEVAWRCPNNDCLAQSVGKIIYFASKDAMDIKSLGEERIKRFFHLGYLRSITDIYTLPYDTIMSLEGMGERSVTQLKSAIESSKTAPLYRILLGLGIRHIGKTTAQKIVQHIHHLNELYNWDKTTWEAIADIGPKVAQSAYDFFQSQENRALLATLEQKGVTLSQTSPETSIVGKFSDKLFLFTGTLSTYTRKEAEALVTQNGGKIAHNVNAQLNYLVVGEKGGSKIKKAMQIPSIHILNETEFIALLNNISQE